MKNYDISAEYAHSRLDYDPISGILRWKYNPLANKTWNTRFAGAIAGSSRPESYMQVNLDGNLVYAHRLIWLMQTNEWPTTELDHINRDKKDNRWKNLRLSSRSENLHNRRKSSSVKSGTEGVIWYKKTQKWSVRIKDGSSAERKFIGYFSSLDEALLARRVALSQEGV